MNHRRILSWSLFFLVLLLASCVRESPQSKTRVLHNKNNTGNSYTGHIVRILVTDLNTTAPVEGAVVFIGRNPPPARKCVTNATGWCEIRDPTLESGSYSVGIAARGYKLYFVSWDILGNKSINPIHNLVVGLKKEHVPAVDVALEGTLIERIAQKGTRSESRFFILKTSEKEYYLFNDMGESRGFDSFAGKKVFVRGYTGTGLVGWMALRRQGVYVQEIKEV